MKLIIAVVILASLFTGYALVRPWLKAQPWAAGFFAAVDRLEILLYKKSETILFARLKMLTGVILMLLTQLGTIDLTPLMPYIPEAHRSLAQFFINLLPLGVTIVGMMDERLRNTTTKPIELVALPENKPLPAEVETAVAVAEQAKAEAVAEVKREGLA